MSMHIVLNKGLDEALENKNSVSYANYIEYVTEETYSYYKSCLVKNKVSPNFDQYIIDVGHHCNTKYFYGITVNHIPSRKDIWLRQLRKLDE